MSRAAKSRGAQEGIAEDEVEAAVIAEEASDVKGKVKHSKRIPYWLWFTIAKSLGIKLHANDKPIVSAILHLLTCGTGAGKEGGVFSKNCY